MSDSLYDVILAPIVTEKSTISAEAHNKSTFLVKKTASKPVIKKAIEKIFNVKVESVNTNNVKGKTKRFKGRIGQRSDFKKAEVTLAKGSKIENISEEV